MREPVSWLELERRAAGELDPARAARVDAAAGADAETGVCLAAAHQARPLRPLPVRVASPSWIERLRRRWAIGAGVLAAATAVILVLTLRGDERRVGGVKGGDLAIELVRERDGVATPAATSFRDGDRFKVLVTCAPDRRLVGAVAIRQAGAVYRPLPPVDVACGNRVPLSGAFRLTGAEAAEVCMETGDGEPVCVTLEPRFARPPP